MNPSAIELPHTAGCLVCGRQNPHGFRLSLRVDETSGVVSVNFTPRPEDIGFEGVVHGGVLATVLDEAMVWAATWAGRRFCVCGEMSVRFRKSAAAGRGLVCEARVEPAGSGRTGNRRLILTTGRIIEADGGGLVAESTGKYVPVPPERNRHVVTTLVDEPQTERAAAVLKEAAR